MGIEPVDPFISAKMRAQHSRDTRPETELRRALFALGARYRKDYALPIPGRRRTADMAFPGKKLAVFVDGCFWHSCPPHGHIPKTRAEWWAEKLARNVARDLETTALLEQAGWMVVRIWEHVPLADATERVLLALGHGSDYPGEAREEGAGRGR